MAESKRTERRLLDSIRHAKTRPDAAVDDRASTEPADTSKPNATVPKANSAGAPRSNPHPVGVDRRQRTPDRAVDVTPEARLETGRHGAAAGRDTPAPRKRDQRRPAPGIGPAGEYRSGRRVWPD